jgi:uncharacterized protein YjiS (DUF1127 family)
MEEAGRHRAALPGRVIGAVRRVWCAYRGWRAKRATALVLRSLDARTLRDIGIDSSEIESLVEHDVQRRRRR